jgi:hypothetical protein
MIFYSYFFQLQKSKQKVTTDANLRLFLAHIQPRQGPKRLRFTPSVDSLRTLSALIVRSSEINLELIIRKSVYILKLFGENISQLQIC